MSEKKLDELFQDKFLDFNEVPDERVWKSIEASLNKKKKRRVLPLLWQVGGIAAALLLGFFVFNPFTENSSTAPTIITDVEDTTTIGNGNTLDSTEISTPNFSYPKEDTSVIVSKETKPSSSANPKASQLTDTYTTEAKKSDNTSSTKQKKSNGTLNNWAATKEDVAKTEEKTANKNIAPKKDTRFTNAIDNTNTQITQVDAPRKENVLKEQATNTNDSSDNNAKEIVTPKAIETAVTANEKEQNSSEVLPKDVDKKSIFQEIEEQEKEAIAENSAKKWSAGPSVAPVYFNAIGEGSSVHSIFIPNSKTGNVNLSYGVAVAYEISPKLSLRSGVHKVDYGYDTNEVAFSSSLEASTNGQIDNIDYVPTSKNLVVSSRKGGSAIADANTEAIDVTAQNPEREGFMSQQLGYVEVPLELNYALIDKKFGLNLIGGLSSLFLVDNSVALTSGNLTTEMGRANNVNDLNFSANFGLGVNYEFSPKIQLNLEPMFKYQLNTFSQTDGTFNPYSVGVYSGLSFRF